jgi:hypothetical protein
MEGFFNIKVGDTLILDDEFLEDVKHIRYHGYTTECNPLARVIRIDNCCKEDSGDSWYDVQLELVFKKTKPWSGMSWLETKQVWTCHVKINPALDINREWTDYNHYIKTFFFTSKEEKESWYRRSREAKMRYHLSKAKELGYKE